ncbi:beta-carotene ketolase/oxygenase CrtW [Chloropicon roscoffensis]|uniref:Beta-carotene ketolase/oxygenase CrtW n=1 Tax=Chloropicon roscoffensis TaxID=1461544 RepID=A0AAX4PGZ9_9CHLO
MVPRAVDTTAITAMAHGMLREVHASGFAPLIVEPTFAPRRILSELGSAYPRDVVGLGLAATIFGGWLTTLPLMFAQPEAALPNLFAGLGLAPGPLAAALPAASAVLVMAFRTWITTGVFVTVHDAIHGQVAPSFPRVNHLVGSVCAFCYASFSYKLLYRDHNKHHANPTAVDDPDYHEGGLKRWLLGFLAHYSTFWQLFWESFQFWSFVAVGQRLMGIPFGHMTARVALVWALPSLLSGLQLFYFGTYLPHRNSPSSKHHARSNDWPWVVSLVTCFHFGCCHEEHHAFPSVAWWELPTVRAQRKGLEGQVRAKCTSN